MITEEVKKFLSFRSKLITLLDDSFCVVQEDYDKCYLEGDTTQVADKIIGLVQKYEDKNVKVKN